MTQGKPRLVNIFFYFRHLSQSCHATSYSPLPHVALNASQKGGQHLHSCSLCLPRITFWNSLYRFPILPFPSPSPIFFLPLFHNSSPNHDPPFFSFNSFNSFISYLFLFIFYYLLFLLFYYIYYINFFIISSSTYTPYFILIQSYFILFILFYFILFYLS